VLEAYPSGSPKSWITRVEGTYYRCHAEGIGIRELHPGLSLDDLQELPKARVRENHGWRKRAVNIPLSAVLH
jgi:hypothetical protein